MPNISFGKMSLERPRGRHKEFKGPGTKWSLGWMHLWMIFCLVLQSTGKAEDVSLHFMHPSRFSGEMEWSSPHPLALHHLWSWNSPVQSWRGYSSLLSLHQRWPVLRSRLCITPACLKGSSNCHLGTNDGTTWMSCDVTENFLFPHRKIEIQIQAFSAKQTSMILKYSKSNVPHCSLSTAPVSHKHIFMADTLWTAFLQPQKSDASFLHRNVLCTHWKIHLLKQRE